MRGDSSRKAPLTLALSLKGRGFIHKLCQVHSSKEDYLLNNGIAGREKASKSQVAHNTFR